MSLFRPEVYEGRRFRLQGDVMLTQATSNWLLVCLLVVVVCAAAVWVMTGHYTRTEQVVGRLVPDGALTSIMPTRPGVIVKLNVREGQQVAAGEPLATVLVQQASPTRADPATQNLASIDKQNALISQQINMSEQAEGDEKTKLKVSVAQSYGELEALDSQIASQSRLVQSARDSFEPLTQATNEGYVSRIEFEGRRQQYLSAEVSLAQLQAHRAQIIGQIRQAKVALAELPVETVNKLDELRATQATLVQKRIEVENATSYVITAPVSGWVSTLQVRQGSTVSRDLPLMLVVAKNTRMLAELYAPSSVIGFAKPGEDVRLMYDAFPYQRFGSFSGKIVEISGTVLAPKDVNSPIAGVLREPVYIVRVALTDQSVHAFGHAVPLQPGMALNASIVLDRRSFFDWLMEPVRAVREKSG